MATVTWIAGTTGSWSVGSNWSGGTAPAATDDVVISGGGSIAVYDVAVTPPALDSLALTGVTGSAAVINVGANTLLVTGSGSGATDIITVSAGMIALGGGTVSATGLNLATADALVAGAGTVATPVTGAGTIQASGGTLVISGGVSAGVNLTIDTTAGSDLLIAASATAAAPVAISSATQTLEIGAAGTLFVGADENYTSGTIKLDGGSAVLGIVGGAGQLSVGSAGTLLGAGKVLTTNLTGVGQVTASGGTLEFINAVTSAGGLTFQVADSAGLQFDSSINAGNTIAFTPGIAGGGSQIIFGNEAGSPGETIVNMNVGVGGALTDSIMFAGNAGFTVVSATGSGTTSGTVVLNDGTNTVTLNVNGLNSSAWNPDTAVISGSTVLFLSDTACYCRGTLILTERGEVAVEDLTIGDRVVTLSGEAKPIKWVGNRIYDGRFIAGDRGKLPVCIVADALAEGIPARDLCVSPEHALYIDGVLVAARLLVNGTTITQAEAVDQVEYFHVELEAHDVLIAEGAAAESYIECDNRGMFYNAGDFAALYPDDQRPRQFCAPRVEAGSAALDAIGMSLMARAAALGMAMPECVSRSAAA